MSRFCIFSMSGVLFNNRHSLDQLDHRLLCFYVDIEHHISTHSGFESVIKSRHLKSIINGLIENLTWLEMTNASTGLRQLNPIREPNKINYNVWHAASEIPYTTYLSRGEWNKVSLHYLILLDSECLRLVSPGSKNDEAIWKTLDLKTSFIISHYHVRKLCTGNGQTLYLKCTKGPIYTLFYTNIVFPTEAEYFFLQNLVWWIFLDYSVRHFCFLNVFGVWRMLKYFWSPSSDVLGLIQRKYRYFWGVVGCFFSFRERKNYIQFR